MASDAVYTNCQEKELSLSHDVKYLAVQHEMKFWDVDCHVKYAPLSHSNSDVKVLRIHEIRVEHSTMKAAFEKPRGFHEWDAIHSIEDWSVTPNR